MGADSKGMLLGHVLDLEILNFIKQTIDKDAVSKVKDYNLGYFEKCDFIKEIYGNNGSWISSHGFIYFKFNGEERCLFYCYNNINAYENLEHYSECGLEKMVKSETTYISSNFNFNGAEIIKKIVCHFGGWFDENDLDDEEPYYIEKNSDENIKPIRYVAMEEIYEKFGEVVKIKDVYYNR